MGILSSLESAAESAGEALGITKKKEEEAATVDAGASAEVDTAQLQDTTPAADVAPPAASVQSYVVQHGDTLSKISERYYGNSHSYMKIFEANRDKLSNPDQIEVGQELTIPS